MNDAQVARLVGLEAEMTVLQTEAMNLAVRIDQLHEDLIDLLHDVLARPLVS
jgi:hypothetical protein